MSLDSLSYGGDSTNLAAGTTVFGSSDFDGYVAYYLEDQNTLDCWTFGDGASWWSGVGCASN